MGGENIGLNLARPETGSKLKKLLTLNLSSRRPDKLQTKISRHSIFTNYSYIVLVYLWDKVALLLDPLIRLLSALSRAAKFQFTPLFKSICVNSVRNTAQIL